MSIEATMTSSSLDDSLYLIKQYLTTRLNESGKIELSTDGSEVIIDLDVLGLKDHKETENLAQQWEQKKIYPIRLYHSFIILGPIYIPAKGNNPCPHCLERRWLENRSKEEQFALMTSTQALIFGHNPRLTLFALETIWAVLESAFSQKSVVTHSESGEYPFYTLNLESLQVSKYQLMQNSSCPVCAVLTPDTPEAAQIELSSCIKHAISNYRLIEATDYNFPMTGYINPVCGVLGSVATLDYLNTLTAPVNGVFRVRNKYGVYDAWWGGHANKYHQSLYLGILEGLERYAGHKPRGKQITIFDSYENLYPDALDPRECGLYQPEYYRKHFPRYLPFSPERKIHWVWGYSFRKACPILVPEQMAYYLKYRDEHAHFVQDSSNGCATGSCLEEAIFYGLLELIERDAFLITWYARLALPRIDPWSCQHQETLFVLDCIDKQGYNLHLFDARLDLSFPAVIGVAKRRDTHLGQIVLAAGSSLDPENAIRGTLCEIASYIPSFVRRLESQLETIRAMVHDYTKVTSLEHQTLLYGLPEMTKHTDFLFQNPKIRSVEDTYGEWMEVSPRNQDLRDDLLYCVDEVLKLGMDVIVVDQTCPEQMHARLKTVCVIVPGLMPMDFGWGRERVFGLPRLKTVPRNAGFRETDFESDVNNVLPHPFP